MSFDPKAFAGGALVPAPEQVAPVEDTQQDTGTTFDSGAFVGQEKTRFDSAAFVAGQDPEQPIAPSVRGFSIDELNADTEARHNRLRVAFELSQQVDGTQASRALKVAQALGVKFSDVLPNLDAFEKAAEQAGFDPAKYERDNVLFARMIDKSPELASTIASDKEISAPAKAFNAWREAGRETETEGTKWGPPGQEKLIDPTRPDATQEELLGEQQLRREKFDEETVKRNKPASVTELDSPEAQAIRDSAPVVRQLRQVKARFGEAIDQVKVQKAEERLMIAEVMHGERSPEAERLRGEVWDLQLATRPLALGDNSGLERNLSLGVEGSLSSVQMGVEGWKGARGGGAAGMVAGGLVGAAMGGTAGAAEGAAIGAELGAQFGGASGVFMGAFKQELTPTYRQNRELKTESGEPIEPQAAFAMALVESAAKAGLEGISFGRQTQALRGALGNLTGTARNLVRTDPTFRKLLASTAKEVLAGGASEGGTGAAQDLVEQVFEYLQKNMVDQAAFADGRKPTQTVSTPMGDGQQVIADNRPLSKDGTRQWKSFEVDAPRMGDASWAEAMGGLLFGGGIEVAHAAARHAVSQNEAARTAKRDEAIPIIVAMAGTPTAQAAPEALADAITEQTAETGEPITELYADSRAVSEVIVRRLQKDESGDFDEVADQLLGEGGAMALREAEATGAKIPIKLSVVLGKLAATEEGKQLSLHMSTRPDSLTMAERAAMKEQIDEQAKKIAGELEGKLGEEVELGTLKEQIVEMLDNAGADPKEARSTAAIFEAMYRTAASESNGKWTPQSVFERFRVQILRGDGRLSSESDGHTPESRAALEGLDQDQQNITVGEDAVALLKEYVQKGEKGAPISPETKARHLYVDHVSGLGTTRAWKGRERTPGKKVMVITSADNKAINDHEHGGHVKLDDLLRLIGAPLQASHPEAVRAGTDFWLEVSDAAEGEKVLEEIRARMPEGIRVDGLVDDGQEVLDDEGKVIDERAAATGKLLGKLQDAKRERGEYKKREDTHFNRDQMAKPGFKFSDESMTAPGLVDDWMMEKVRSTSANPGDFESEEAFIKEAFFDPNMPGTLSPLGASLVGQRAHTVAMDGIGLKALNQALGKLAGNLFLELIAQAARDAGGEGLFFTHRSGDEFEARHDDPDVLQIFVEDFQALLEERTIDWTSKTGELFEIVPQIRYGIAKGTYADADRVLNERKRAEDPNARRPSFRKAGTGPSDGNQVSRAGDLDARGRRAAARRGEQTQLGNRAPDAGGEAQGADFDPKVLDLELDADAARQRPPSQSLHAPEDMKAAREAAEAMRPQGRARMHRFLDFVEGWDSGAERPSNGLTRAEELALAKKFGIVDPQYGLQVRFPHGYKGPKTGGGAGKSAYDRALYLDRLRAFKANVQGDSYWSRLPRSRRSQTVDLMEGREQLTGLDKKKTITKHEFAAVLEQRYREKFLGGEPMKLDDFSDEAVEKLAGWMAEELDYALAPERIAESGYDWYTTKFAEAVDLLAAAIPSLKEKVNRDQFTIVLAISSNGEEATQNFANAVKLYQAWEASHEDVDQRRLDPAVIKVARGDALFGNIVAVNEAVRIQGGTSKAAAWLLQEHKVSELNELAAKDGLDFDSGYSPDQVLPMSALVLGPKLGAFWANLMGLGQYLTMDMWAMRMINRMRGQLTLEATPESLDRLRTLLGDPSLNEEELLANIIAFESEVYERDWQPDIQRRPAGLDPKAKFVPEPLNKAKVLALFEQEAVADMVELQRQEIAKKWRESGDRTKKQFDPDGSFRRAKLVPPAYHEQQFSHPKMIERREGAAWQRVKKAINERYVKDDGRDPEEAAKELGYHDAREMLTRVEIERVANGVYGRIFDDLREAPAGSGERAFVIRAVDKARQKAQEKLDKEKRGVTLNTAAVQAILWFYEKRLYKEFRVKGPAIVSYKDSSRAWLQANGFPVPDAGDSAGRPPAPEARGHVARGPGGVPVTTLEAGSPVRRNQLDENPELRDQVEPVLRDLLLEHGIRRSLVNTPEGIKVLYAPGNSPVPENVLKTSARVDSQVYKPEFVEFDRELALLYEPDRQKHEVRPRVGGPKTAHPQWTVMGVNPKRKRQRQPVSHHATEAEAIREAKHLDNIAAHRIPIAEAWAAFAPDMAPELRADVEQYVQETRAWEDYNYWAEGQSLSRSGVGVSPGDEVKIGDTWRRVARIGREPGRDRVTDLARSALEGLQGLQLDGVAEELGQRAISSLDSLVRGGPGVSVSFNLSRAHDALLGLDEEVEASDPAASAVVRRLISSLQGELSAHLRAPNTPNEDEFVTVTLDDGTTERLHAYEVRVRRGQRQPPIAKPSQSRRRNQLDESNPELRDQVEPVLRDLLLEHGIEIGGERFIPADVAFVGDTVQLIKPSDGVLKVEQRADLPNESLYVVTRTRPGSKPVPLSYFDSRDGARNWLEYMQAHDRAPFTLPIEEAWNRFAPDMAPELRADVQEYLREVREWKDYNEWKEGDFFWPDEDEALSVGDEVKLAGDNTWRRVKKVSVEERDPMLNVVRDAGTVYAARFREVAGTKGVSKTLRKSLEALAKQADAIADPKTPNENDALLDRLTELRHDLVVLLDSDPKLPQSVAGLLARTPNAIRNTTEDAASLYDGETEAFYVVTFEDGTTSEVWREDGAYIRRGKRTPPEAKASENRRRNQDDENELPVEGPRWWSAVERAAELAKQEKNTPSAWWSTISKAPGVKAEELQLMGLQQWLAGQKGSLTKADLLGFIQKHAVQVTEQVLDDRPASKQQIEQASEEIRRLLRDVEPTYRKAIEADGSFGPKVDALEAWVDNLKKALGHLTQSTPDFRRVRELLEYAAANEGAVLDRLIDGKENEATRLRDLPLFSPGAQYHEPDYAFRGEESGSYRELLFHSPGAGFAAPHFWPHNQNLIAHARVAIHADTGGRRVLVLNEVQSDLHQHARGARDRLVSQYAYKHGVSPAEASKAVPLDAGYVEPGVAPNENLPRTTAPLKTGWEEFVAKRALMLAVENGLDRVAWTTGQTQARRYGKLEDVNELTLTREPDEVLEDKEKPYRLSGLLNGAFVFEESLSLEAVSKRLGPSLAQRLLEQQPEKLIPPALEQLSDGSWRVNGELESPEFATKAEAEADLPRIAAQQDVYAKHKLSGVQYEHGGEGMKAAYDVRLPSLFRKLVKPFGGTVTQAEILTPGDANGNKQSVWVVDVPAELRTLLRREGMPLLQEDDSKNVAPAPAATTPGAPAAAPAAKVERPPHGYYIRTVEQGRALYQIFRNPSANPTTILHEAAHSFLDMMKDMGEAADASARARAKWKDTLEWLGVTAAEWADLDTTEDGRKKKDELHERFARTFEQYMTEGRAPSRALERVFTRFKLWLVAVYRAFTNQRDFRVDPKIRSIFDRLLATDDERKRHLGKRGEPLFKSAQEANMSEEGWREKLQMDEEDSSFNTKAAELWAVKEQLAEHEDAYAELLAAARKDAEKTFDDMPAERARQLLDGNAELQAPPVVLDRAQVEAVAGKDFDRAKIRTTVIGGMPIDQAALEVGQSAFPTGAALVKGLLEAPDRETWVQAQAEAAVKAQRGDVVDERKRLQELVAGGLAAFIEKRQLEEWDALVKQSKRRGGMGAPLAPPVEALKEAARLMVLRRPIGGMAPGRSLQAERTAAKEKARAGLKGEHQKALLAAQRQLLNSFVYDGLLKAQEQARNLEQRMAELRNPKALARLGLASPEFRDAVLFILEAFQQREPHEMAPVGADSVRKALDVMVQDGTAIGEPDWFLDLNQALTAAPGFYAGDRMASLEFGKLTVRGMGAVRDALTVLTKAAAHRRTVLLDDRRVERGQVIADLLVEVTEHKPKLPPRKNRESTPAIEELKHFLSGFDGFLRNPIDLVRELTGDDPNTTLWRLFVNPMRRAKYDEARILEETMRPIIEAMEALPESVREKLSSPIDGALLFNGHTKAFSVPLRRHELLMMALNTGNASNLQRLTDGRQITTDQAAAALSMLTKEEIAWVNSVWRATEKLRPQAFDLEERMTGLRPEGFKATPLALPNGTLTGGYFPAIYESSASNVGERQNADLAAASVLNPSFTRPNTPHSHLKKRSNKVEAVISLSVSNVYSHFAQTAHDLAFREVLLSAASVLLDGSVQAALKERLGEEKTRQFRLWLQDVGAAAVPAMNRVQQLQQVLKGRLAPVLLGWKTATALGDFANVPTAITSTKLQVSHLSHAFAACMGSPIESHKFAMERSKELKFMDNTLRKQFQGAVENFTKRGVMNQGFPRWYRDNAFAFMEGVQKLTATPVWLGAYRQALAEDMSEDAAARWADDILTQVWPSHSSVEQAGIIRDKGWAGVSMTFYGYLSVAYRSQARLLSELTSLEFEEAGSKEKAGTVAKVSGRLLAFYVSFQVFGELLMGRGPDDGDKDKEDPDAKTKQWAAWFFRKLLSAPLQTNPVTGEMVPILDAALTGRRAQARSGVLSSYLMALGQGAQDAWDGKDKKTAVQQSAAALKALFFALGLPIAPINQAEFLLDVGLGNRETSPSRLMSGAVYGERTKNPPATPITAAGDLLEAATGD